MGPKSAAPMLNQIGSLKDIYDNLEAVRELGFRGAKKMPEKLAEFRDQAFMSYDLATIKTDIELDETIAELTNREPDQDKLRQLYASLEFKSWLKDLDVPQSARAEQPGNNETTEPKARVEQNYSCILKKEEFEQWLEKLRAADVFAFDTETTSLKYMDA
ncbi:MAG: 5'-3' exonuclease H3TH domain-containing protein, partial [Pseudomonadales bacterium]